jgi:hypothetical protein
MKPPVFLRTALYHKARELMRSYMCYLDHFGHGDIATAERCFPPMVSKRKRAMRIVRKLTMA